MYARILKDMHYIVQLYKNIERYALHLQIYKNIEGYALQCTIYIVHILYIQEYITKNCKE